MSCNLVFDEVSPSYVIAIGALIARHLLGALLWPRISRNERFYLTLPQGFQIGRQRPGSLFLTVRVWLLFMALGALTIPVLLAAVWEMTGGGSVQLRILAFANLCLIAVIWIVDGNLMRRWKARALG